MKTNMLAQVKANPRFTELVEKRQKLALILTVAMLAVYFGFILLVAFGKGLLAAKLGGGVMTVGIPVGIGVILSAFALTGIYVFKANAEFDVLTRKIVEETR